MPWQPLPGSADPDPEPMRGALDRVVRHLGAPSADALERLYGRWPEVAGEALAAHTRPLALRDGTLVVAVDDPAWATHVRFAERQLLDALAQVLDGPAPARLEVRVRPRGGA